MQTNYLEKLNSEQIKPVMDTDGAVLVIAGAGSGKTRVLTSRIAYLVNELGVNPAEILAITFTNKAADEMKNRLATMVPSVDGMWVSTIHSMCVKILRSSITFLGYDKNFSIYSEDDKERVLKRILTEKGLEADKYLKACKNAISDAKNADLNPQEYKDENVRMPNVGVITEVFELYEQELKRANALDFDDLLIKTLHLFMEFDEICEYYSRRFTYVHIDEFQDTNTVQYKIARYLSSYHGNIFVVGDDDQSIYGWRGAKIQNILEFEKHFRGAKVYKLEQNYRSTKNILNLANLIIRNNQKRKSKVLWTENEVGEKPELYVSMDETSEAERVALNIKSQINKGKKASDFAVLMRVNALSRSFEQEFLKYNIPYKVFGGFKFFDRKEIKDLTAYLRIITNPLDNEAVLRVINVPRRGIGDKTIEVIKSTASEKGTSVYEQVSAFNELPLGGSAKSRIQDFKDTIYDIMMASLDKSVPEIVKLVIDRTDFLSQFAESTEENESKKMNVNELVNSAEEFSKINKGASLTDYLGSITLSSDTDEMDESNYVSIATVHAVKGLEFDTVYVAGLDETIFPISRACDSQEELEEERRLMYVAITRAKRELYLTRARSRYLYGNRSITQESRFLREIMPLLSVKGNLVNGYSAQRSYGYGNETSYRNYSNSSDGSEFGYYADENTSYGRTKSFNSGYKVTETLRVSNKPSSAKYSVGMKVIHKKFGKGTVIAVKAEGKFIDVAFVGAGIKSLASEIAPLEIDK
ncbi:MAG: UvrD-helicase domain-containing protein [Clostridia bacterium]|nr:UvrD-helicase domain-containing protein [Clostridia bacterium]